VYYYGWLLLGMLLCWKYGRSTKQKSVRSALYALAIGYASFLVPTTIANTIDPSTIAGIPSIMCGFAVILAFVLVGRVLPEAAR
jgi:fatty acid desaturase